MDLNLLERRSEYEWEIPQQGAMRVPAVIFASEALMRDMDRKVYEQAVNVAALPGMPPGLARPDVVAVQQALAHELSRAIPAGVGSTGEIRLGDAEMDAMLAGGAAWAVQRGWGVPEDLERIEENGQMKQAKPGCVSPPAKKRQPG